MPYFCPESIGYKVQVQLPRKLSYSFTFGMKSLTHFIHYEAVNSTMCESFSVFSSKDEMINENLDVVLLMFKLLNQFPFFLASFSFSFLNTGHFGPSSLHVLLAWQSCCWSVFVC